MERAKPVARSACSAAAAGRRAVTGQGPKCGALGSARNGGSGKLSSRGASRCGAPATRSGAPSSQGWGALSESVFVEVPTGGAAIDCARKPHIGAAANALGAQASESTNVVSVHRRTNQTCCELRAVDITEGGEGP